MKDKIEMMFRSSDKTLWKVAQRACHTLRISYYVAVTRERNKKRWKMKVVQMSTQRMVSNFKSLDLYLPYRKIKVLAAKVHYIKLCKKI